MNDIRRSANANRLDNLELDNKIAQLNVGSLLDAGAQGQGTSQGLTPAGPSDINTSNVAGDLANSLAPESSPHGQRPAGAQSNDVAGDLANQIAGGGATVGESQSNPQGQVAAAQSGSAGPVVVEVKQTIIQEANGQQIQTAIVEQQAQGQQPAAAPAPIEAPVTTTPQALAPSAEVKPTEPSAVMLAFTEGQSNATAAEAAPKPSTPVEGMSVMVCTLLLITCLY